ncbi:protein kinase C and casein kinase substrate in neurons protein 2 isoform X5 [Parasteatoda tepidariorum]|uniref:protein kinase C and casein kinase substrate in neurons protein 2 isoform X5 n=1 Tax=Parasteatoda tepidariorum TaxID=114398 RepID=UPI0039BCD9D7
MSHHSDDAMLLVGSDSFWEPGNYKRTTKRIEDSFRLCNDLILLIQERSEIEKTYAKSLRNWSKKWNETIEKGPEYGTTEAAWKAVLIEADRRCDMHLRVKDQLLNDTVTQIKLWQKDNFHKTMMNIKEKKEMDDSFKKVTKLQDRVTKCKFEAQRAKERYQQALEEINDYNAKYMEDMTVVFDKCQEFEEKRLDFFKEMLFGIHGCLNISTDPELPQIYEEYRHSIQNADAKKDLKWWSNNHGVGMAMNWPQFEEYCEEFRDIGKLKKGAVPESGILLVNQQKIGEDLPEYSTETQNGSKKEKRGTDGPATKMRMDKNKPSSNRNSGINLNGKQEQNPFDDDQEDWEESSNDALVDNGEPGVPVRALYDYEGAEADELSFKNGEVFEKLEDEDEQGWCKGRKDGRVGLYPASYVELVAN